MLGLYIHVPFCSAICNYCNFNRGLFDADLKARYVEALITEIRTQSAIRNPQSAMSECNKPSPDGAAHGVGAIRGAELS
jgi:coproporphyrinogen III oxidase-like Fe-S oxidoreductase